MTKPPRFPNASQRTTIIGKTGSGKTQFAAHVLSTQPFDKQPYVILDYKHDELLNSVKGVQELKLGTLPKSPGLYIVHALDGDDEEVEKWLWDVFHAGNIGLYFDEGTMVPQKHNGKCALKAILTQGRSRRVPAITVTQRPSGVLRTVFSEADFFAAFYLTTDADKKRVLEMMPPGTMEGLRQDYHCRWYDVQRDQLTHFRPVPNGATIRAELERRLAAIPRRRKWGLF